jgi:hypothetical protein
MMSTFATNAAGRRVPRLQRFHQIGRGPRFADEIAQRLRFRSRERGRARDLVVQRFRVEVLAGRRFFFSLRELLPLAFELVEALQHLVVAFDEQRQAFHALADAVLRVMACRKREVKGEERQRDERGSREQQALDAAPDGPQRAVSGVQCEIR